MSALWTLSDIARATNGQAMQLADVHGISIDTRTLTPGDLFVALKDVRDGHDFVAAAFEKGAAAALVSREVPGIAEDKLVRVDDTLAALEALARDRRKNLAARVAAVTGSVGKTSTKEALRQLLSAQAPTHASVASYNNLWGVPLSLARTPTTARFAIYEIGMNHAGEITPLTAQVRPHVAIITTVAAVHLENFTSVGEIADAKGEIFSGLEPGGIAIINGDIEWTERLALHAGNAMRIIRFGRLPSCDVRLLSLELGESHCDLKISLLGKNIVYRVGATGEHWAMNSMCVLAAISALQGDVERAAADMSQLSALAGRGAREQVSTSSGAFDLIDESYNANPMSMAAAIATLGRIAPGAKGRRIAVLGDMLELGPSTALLHAKLLEPLAQHRTDLVFCSGPLMKHLWTQLEGTRRGGWALDAVETAKMVALEVKPGDVVMVKGSYGSKMRVVVDALRAMDEKRT